MQRIDSALSNRLAKMSFICSLMVVALHGYCGPDWVHRLTGFLFVAVPLFFSISGYLFAGRMEGRWYFREVLKKVRTLIVPYVLWNVMRWLFVLVVGGSDFTRMVKEGIDLHNWWLILGINPFRMPLPVFWFVGCIIVMVFISPVFTILRQQRIGSVLLAAIYLIGMWFVAKFRVDDDGLGWACYCWIRAVLFFGLGVYLRFHPISRAAGRMVALTCLAIGFLGICGYLLAWITMPFAMIGMWTLTRGGLPRWLTGVSFPIYYLHIFVGTLMGGCFSSIHLNQGYAFVWLIKVFAMAMFSIAIALLLKRMFPRFASIAFGGRG